MTTTNDIYSQITQKIITDLEKGQLTWRKPWSDKNLASHVMRPLRWNDIPYTGINTIMLWATAAEKGYASPYWMTYRQATDMKAHIRKGEKGASVVYADKFTKEEKGVDGTTSVQQIPFLKVYTVFNASQIEGLPEAFYKLPEPIIVNEEKRIEALEQFFEQTKANIFTGSKAAYSVATDRIEMPPFECFTDATGYYATLAHELTHWTRHPRRLDRDFDRKKWGDEGYAKEELVAELGACFLGADLGFAPKSYEEHAAYIKGWLIVLKNDSRFIFHAAAHAQKAVEYVRSLQESPKPVPPPQVSKFVSTVFNP
jgi:antirestriction protein ArdC